jgi:putative nucleotidyltransferase with HDIG domain
VARRVHLGQDPLTLSKPAVAAAATFFLCNSGLVATAVALSRREPVLKLWQQNFMWTAPACFIGAGVAVLAIRVVMTMQIWVVLLAAAPLYLTYRSYRIYLGRVEDQERHLKQVSELHIDSVEALALAIDARAQTFDRSHGPNDNHIRRVQAAAAQLARAAGMSSDEVEGVEVAALLHDIGKLAVPEHILTKPGRLTPDEYERVRIHPQVGADIIRAVPFPYPVAPYIESHHERWDGSGHPEGLAGEAIRWRPRARYRRLLRCAHHGPPVPPRDGRARRHGAAAIRRRPGTGSPARRALHQDAPLHQHPRFR